ncbi:MAG: hypothetical protein C0407_03360 [Desulfobacca sp.]|nr:hypothetical protein [Desulfobacca sp.]
MKEEYKTRKRQDQGNTLSQRKGGRGGLLVKKGSCRAGFFKQEVIRGKEEGDYQNLDKLFPLHPDLPLSQNGGLICGSLEHG